MTTLVPRSAPRTFAVEVLGCKVNQHEAQQIRQSLEDAGWSPASAEMTPEIVVVHGCAVTAEALRQSLQRARRSCGVSRVILSGCAAAPEFVQAIETGIGAVIPAGPDWNKRLKETLHQIGVAESSAMGEDRKAPLRRFAGRARAFVQAQNGCDLGCAYCVVPRLRGPPRDRPLDEIEAEAKALSKAGHAELVITGVCVGLYGRNGGPTLADVIRRLDHIESVRRLRLSSLHPAELTDELLDAWRTSPKMAPHAHLPLQSGSDSVLRRMKRGYTTASFAAAVERLRRALDRPAVTTDVIVGFPGETEADFEATVRFAQTMGFSRIHIFRFSPRPGTPAAQMKPTVPMAAVRERAAQLKAESERLTAAFHEAFIGETVDVLAETRSARRNRWRGYCGRYIPVAFAAGPEWGGRIARVRIVAADARGARAVLGDSAAVAGPA